MPGPHTVTDLFCETIKRRMEREAVVCRKGRLTYAEFGARISGVVRKLREFGLPEGERLGALFRNCHYSYEAAGIAALGGWIFVPLNYLLTEAELVNVVRVAEMRALLFDAEFEAVAHALRRRCPDLRLLVTTGQAQPSVYPYEAMATVWEEPAVPAATHEADTYCVLFTSGTTGEPKGVMLSHRNMVENAMVHVREYEITDTSRGMVVNPHFFSGALNCTTIPMLSAGATNVFLDGFSPKAFLETVERERISHVQVVPTMIYRLLDSQELGRYDVSSLRIVSYGSAPMSVSRLQEALKAFGPVFIQVYGMTEFTSISALLRKKDHVVDGTEVQLRRLRSCGRPRMGAEIRLVDDQDRPVPVGSVGEIVKRGATVMQGYWDLPEETATTLRKGWLHSGDMAWQDEDGYLYLVDRKRDLIISGGINIAPGEVEQALYMHPAVHEVAVVGVPDPQWGEAVKAVVVLRPGAKVSEVELIGYCAGRLAGYKKPKSVDFVPQLPKGPTGKILRRVVREQYWQGQPRRVS